MDARDDRDTLLAEGRDGYERRSWRVAAESLVAADARGALGSADLERLAVAAYMAGRGDASVDAMARAFERHVAEGAAARATRCAFWLGNWWSERGERAHASGWFARAARAVSDAPPECAERGLLLVPDALRAAGAGDFAGGYACFEEAARIGERAGDDDLVTLARQGQGRALLYLGETAKGVAHLDEAMIMVTRSRVSPMIVGIVYCSVLDACSQIGDVARAREWTAALAAWCDTQPDLVPFRGPCMVHRAEVFRLAGSWREALDESERACGWLVGPPRRPGAGAAMAQRGDLMRLHGRFEEAEAAYQLAAESGWSPQPGWALLHLAQGRVDAARRALDHDLEAAGDPVRRALLLAPVVEATLASGDVAAAQLAADEFVRLADRLGDPVRRAFAAHASGAVALARGDAATALAASRSAALVLGAHELPFEAALARVLEARALSAGGDPAAAAVALRSARREFERLGAAPAAAEVDALAVALGTPRENAAEAHGLTPREAQVLRVVATGASNKDVAACLAISERTVERHLSNVFAKLGFRSRTEAVAFAYRHSFW